MAGRSKAAGADDPHRGVAKGMPYIYQEQALVSYPLFPGFKGKRIIKILYNM
jgi:hypothetical protein